MRLFESSFSSSIRPNKEIDYFRTLLKPRYWRKPRKDKYVKPTINLLWESERSKWFNAVVYANSASSDIGALYPLDFPYESYPELTWNATSLAVSWLPSIFVAVVIFYNFWISTCYQTKISCHAMILVKQIYQFSFRSHYFRIPFYKERKVEYFLLRFLAISSHKESFCIALTIKEESCW